MKSKIGPAWEAIVKVAPYMGAWIEIGMVRLNRQHMDVAPYMGAWIEISLIRLDNCINVSLPTWERGLKLMVYITEELNWCRSLHGSVD